MSVLIDLVAFTLLPVWRWRVITEQLRAGEPPAAILATECDQRGRRAPRPRGRAQPVDADQLRARASQALERAARSGLEALAWDDVRYPALLAAISDARLC